MQNGRFFGGKGEDIYGIKGRRVSMVGIRDMKNYTPEHFTWWLGSNTQQKYHKLVGV